MQFWLLFSYIYHVLQTLQGIILIFWIFIFIYLAAPGLMNSCGMWDLLSVPCKLLAAARGIQFSDQEFSSGPLHWEHGVLAPWLPGKPCLQGIIITLLWRRASFSHPHFTFPIVSFLLTQQYLLVSEVYYCRWWLQPWN